MANGLTVSGSRTSIKKCAIILLPVVLAACSNTGDRSTSSQADTVEPISIDGVPVPTISDKTKFASKDYGVSGSPRVTKSKRTPKGGGSYKIGKPYTIRGKRYVPREDPDYSKVGLASWYGPNFHGRLTANGEIYDQYSLSAAHPTMPLPSYAKVTNLENGASLTVRVNDRGPYAHNRIIDLSAHAARLLGYTKKGLAKVRVEYVGKARMDGLDEGYLVASYNPGTLSPVGNIMVADVDAGNQGGLSVRTSLQAYDQGGFAAPVPEFRPLTNNGYEVDVSAINPPRPNGLISGFVAADRQSTPPSKAINRMFSSRPVMKAPEQGVADLRRIVVGPFTDQTELVLAEKTMLHWGPATVQHNEMDNTGSVHAIVAEESLSAIIATLRSRNIYRISSDN